MYIAMMFLTYQFNWQLDSLVSPSEYYHVYSMMFQLAPTSSITEAIDWKSNLKHLMYIASDGSNYLTSSIASVIGSNGGHSIYI